MIMTTIAHVRSSRTEFLADGDVEKFLINIIEYERPNELYERIAFTATCQPTDDRPTTDRSFVQLIPKIARGPVQSGCDWEHEQFT